MKLENFLRFNAVLLILFGSGFVLAPNFMTSLYGASLDEVGQMVARLMGAAFLGFGILRGSLRKTQDPESRRTVLLSALVEDVIGFVVLLMAQLNGLMNTMGWSNVVLYGVFAGGFLYFFLADKR